MDQTAIAVQITEMDLATDRDECHLNHIQTRRSFLTDLANILLVFAVQDTTPAGWIQYKLTADRMGTYPATFYRLSGSIRLCSELVIGPPLGHRPLQFEY